MAPAGSKSALLSFRTSDEAHRVTPFELLFDLVFVFAFTQVTEYVEHTHSAYGVLQALIVLGILWWSWVSYAWLANQTFVDEGLARVGMAVAMAAMFIVALVIPEAFHDLEGGLTAPLLFVFAYAVVRLAHLFLYFVASREDVALRRQLLLTSVALFSGAGFFLVGAFLGGTRQTWLWLVGLAVDVALTYVTSRRGSWRVHSAAHWAERFGLIVLLALGESIVAIGVGVTEEAIGVPILIGSLLAVAFSILLWWLHFDVVSTAAERQLTQLKGSARAALAIDGYAYLHFAIIAGIIISALGLEEAMHHVADAAPFGFFGAAALLGGAGLYLAGHGAFARRVNGSWKVWRFGAGTLLLALLPLAATLPTLVVLALVVAVISAVVIIETVRYSGTRARTRTLSEKSAEKDD